MNGDVQVGREEGGWYEYASDGSSNSVFQPFRHSNFKSDAGVPASYVKQAVISACNSRAYAFHYLLGSNCTVRINELNREAVKNLTQLLESLLGPLRTPYKDGRMLVWSLRHCQNP